MTTDLLLDRLAIVIGLACLSFAVFAGISIALGLLGNKVLNERSHIPPKRPPEV